MAKKLIFLVVIIIIVVCGILVFLNHDTSKNNNTIKDDTPSKNEPYKNETKIDSNYSEDDEKVDLKYDQYIVASGYAGASNNVYYTRNNILYHLILSDNKTIKLAEGVEKIEKDIDSITAYKGNNFKIIVEDSYVTYMD